MRKQHRDRGFTMLEMMAVVGIVGVLSSIAVFQIRGLLAVGQVNGGATTMARILSTARVRALTMHCPVLVQINGPGYVYAGATVGMPGQPRRVSMILKGDCASVNPYYETGDRIISDFTLEKQLVLQFPVTLIAAGTLTAESVVIGYPDNAVAPKTVYLDPGGGVFASVPTPLIDMQWSARVPNIVRHTFVPDNAIPYCD